MNHDSKEQAKECGSYAPAAIWWTSHFNHIRARQEPLTRSSGIVAPYSYRKHHRRCGKVFHANQVLELSVPEPKERFRLKIAELRGDGDLPDPYVAHSAAENSLEEALKAMSQDDLRKV